MILSIVKMVTGETLLAEVTTNENKTEYILNNPILINVELDNIFSMSYLPGSYDIPLTIKSDFIITMVVANNFFRRLYGSSLMRLCIEHQLQCSFDGHIGKTELLEFLKSKKIEFISKYGMINEDEFSFENEEYIHTPKPIKGILH